MASAERPVFFQRGTKDSHLAFSSGKSRENRGAVAVHDGLSERNHEFESGFLQHGVRCEPAPLHQVPDPLPAPKLPVTGTRQPRLLLGCIRRPEWPALLQKPLRHQLRLRAPRRRRSCSSGRERAADGLHPALQGVGGSGAEPCATDSRSRAARAADRPLSIPGRSASSASSSRSG
jgi:hypothetical protein